jgi:outer membrane protein OmpA-like peptidoglycan-associated protein
MNSTKLDKNALNVIGEAFEAIKAKITPTSKVEVKVTGWVQPTLNSPNVQKLSRGRANSVVSELKRLGLSASYRVNAPGEDRRNVPASRRATVVVTITN